MASRRQHTLPQFFLKGFASRTTRKNAYVFRFASDADPAEPNISQVGASRDFYGGPESPEVDRKITDVDEPRFAPLVGDLRDHEGAIDHTRAELLPALVAHLEHRTRHNRDMFTVWTDDSFAMLKKELDKTLASWSPDARTLALRYLDKGIPEVASQARQHVVQTQLTTLAKPAEEDPRTRALAGLSWHVLRFSDHELVLGGLGPVARFQNRAGLASPFENLPLDAILLPLSHSRLLVGYHSATEPPAVDTEELNLASAELSYEMFASQRTEREDRYASVLARRASLSDR